MFQLAGSNRNQESHNALPNYYGRIRTLKKDYAAYKEGKLANDENPEEKLKSENQKSPLSAISFSDENETVSAPSPFQMPVTAPSLRTESQPTIPSAQPPIREERARSFANQEPAPTSLPVQKPSSPLPGEKFELPQETSPFPENKPSFAEDMSERDLEKEVAKQGGVNKKFVAIAIIFLILILGGAGFYYWRFFVENNSQKAPIAPETAATPQVSQPEAENKGLRYLNIDTSGKIDPQSSLRNLASNFLPAASDNELIEVKLLTTDNQQFGIKEFAASFKLTMPSALKEKFADDYSLFIKNEKSEARAGAVFKLSDSAGVAENLKQWEPTMIADFGSFYLSQKPANESASFSSSRYKNADIRYYNFPSPNPGSPSFDYSFVTDNVSHYLIIGTSKETIRSILDYLLKQE